MGELVIFATLKGSFIFLARFTSLSLVFRLKRRRKNYILIWFLQWWHQQHLEIIWYVVTFLKVLFQFSTISCLIRLSITKTATGKVTLIFSQNSLRPPWAEDIMIVTWGWERRGFLNFNSFSFCLPDVTLKNLCIWWIDHWPLLRLVRKHG